MDMTKKPPNKEKPTICPDCGIPMKKEIIDVKNIPESYFMFRPDVEPHQVCYNAKSKNCIKCREECEYAGRIKK